MRNKTIIYLLALTVVAVLSTAYGINHHSDNAADEDIRRLTIKLKLDKERYLPGELVTLTIKCRNDSQDAITLPATVDVDHRHVQIFIADASGNYREYFGPGWGRADVIALKGMKLERGQEYETTVTILYNQAIDTSHLSALYASRIAKERLTGPYALSEPGVYSIKAVVSDADFSNKVESAPAIVVVDTPQGVDLDVWNMMKGDGDYARFIQTGELLEKPNGPKSQKIERSLKDITSHYPASIYTHGIRSGLMKRAIILEKEKESAKH